jgi:hypothetical protein
MSRRKMTIEEMIADEARIDEANARSARVWAVRDKLRTMGIDAKALVEMLDDVRVEMNY